MTRLKSDKDKLQKEVDNKITENLMLKDQMDEARVQLRENKIENKKAGNEQKGLKEKIEEMKMAFESQEVEINQIKSIAIKKEKDFENLSKSKRTFSGYGISPSHKYHKSMENNFNHFFGGNFGEIQSEPTVKAPNVYLGTEEEEIQNTIQECEEFNQR